MKRKLLLVICIFASFYGIAQEEIPELITDRPDQTESAAVVPIKSLQIETGFIVENNETSSFSQKSFAYNTSLLRYGLLNNVELRLGLEFLGDREDNKNTDIRNSISGLSPLSVGFKIKIMDEKGCSPEIAFLGGMNLPFMADDNYKPSYSSANMRFAFAHTLSDRFSLGYNIGAEWDGETANPAYFYSVALGVGITNNLGMFVESYGLLPEVGVGENLIDVGFTYLLAPNIQFDISGGLGINDEAIDNFVSVGLSIRIPE